MVRADTTESRAEGGGGMIEAGEYHWMIEDAVAETSDYGTSLKVVTSVLAGTVPAMVGRKHTEFFQLSGKAVDRLRRLLVATGMMTDEQWVAQIGQPLEFDETMLKGRQFCAKVSMKPYRGNKEEHKGKSFPETGFDIWGVFDPKSANIPKDRDCLALLASSASGPVAGQSQPSATVAKPAAATAKPQSFAW